MAACLLFALPLLTRAEATKRKILIDDDSFSLMHMMLLGSETTEVLGVVSVTGNSWANRVTAYVLRGLELVDRSDVPVAHGAMYPLLNTEASTERWEALYGRLLWKGVWMKSWAEDTLQTLPTYYGPNDPIDIEWGNPTTKPIPEIAANFLIETVRKYPGEVTIIVGGPFTNVALAQRLDPEFASLAKELVYMGGSFNPRQLLDNEVAEQFAREFANSPRREFNIRLDPEAASIAARSPWKKITVIPVDPSTETQLDKALLAKVQAAAPAAMHEVFENWEPGFPLWDEIASAVWLDPSLVVEKRTLYVDYNTQFGPSYGDTLSWSEGYQPGLGEQSAEVILRVDTEALVALLLKNVSNLSL